MTCKPKQQLHNSKYWYIGVKYSLDKAAEAVKKAMNGVGGQGKVMLEDKPSTVGHQT